MSRPPKFRDLAAAIEASIRQKGLGDGEQLPSEKALAGEFGVNHLTVRRAMAVLETQGAIHRIPSKGSYVGKASKGPGSRGLIGVLYPEEEGFYYEILSGLESRMTLAGYSPVVHISRWSPASEMAVLDTFSRMGVDGIIAVPNVDCAAVYRKLGVPVVFFDSYVDVPKIPYVITDDKAGALRAVEHLVALGHARIAYVGGAHEKTSEARRSAYVEVLEQCGLKFRADHCLEKEYSREWGYNAAGMLFATARGNSPTAVFCGSDAIAAGFMSYLNSRQITVPGQVSVMGFGNLVYSEFMALSTVDQPRNRIADAIWKNMSRLLAGQSVAGGTIIPTTLIVRQTTATPRKKPHGLSS